MIAGIIAIAVIALMAFGGYKKGGILMLFSLISCILAFIGAKFLADILPGEFTGGLSFPIAFVIMLIILFVVARALKLVDKVPLVGFANKLIGLAGGLLMGLLIVIVVLYAIDLLTIIPQISDFSQKYLVNDPLIGGLKSIDFIGIFTHAGE